MRWNLSKNLRRFSKKLPYFLMYNYPKKMETYKSRAALRKRRGKDVELSAYHSPSPLNEICDYFETWEKRNIVWANTAMDTRCLIVDHDCDLSDKQTRRAIMRCLNHHSAILKALIAGKMAAANSSDTDKSVWQSKIDVAYNNALSALLEIVPDRRKLANYAIDVVYSHANQNQSFVWKLFGDEIIENLKANTPERKRSRIVEVPYQTESSTEYLGKYYEILTGVSN